MFEGKVRQHFRQMYRTLYRSVEQQVQLQIRPLGKPEKKRTYVTSILITTVVKPVFGTQEKVMKTFNTVLQSLFTINLLYV
jgi:hypothetical protein